jgi:adenine-specific DNA-methyltransferase
MKITTKNKLGQYFTKNEVLKKKVLNFILNKPQRILEPSIGQGDLVAYIQYHISDIIFDMYEIDSTIPVLETVSREHVIYCDFMQQDITYTYKTIVGNPPYIRTKIGNLYIDFVDKCYRLLDNEGELIFIVPSDFFKLTSSSKLLNEMMINGSFTHIFHPHNEKMFENACIDIVVFRYCKNRIIPKVVMYNERQMYIINKNGLITFSEMDMCDTNNETFEDYFDIYVGIVSGKDEVYKNKDLGNIEVLNGENNLEKYVYIDQYPCDIPEINNYLLENKHHLIERRIKKFNENNWFEWGAPRNINNIKNNIDKDCIYIYNLSRKNNVAFSGKVNYFGGGLIMLIPKKNVNLNNIISYINSDNFKKNFMFSGRFKIGHRQISNSYIPTLYL